MSYPEFQGKVCIVTGASSGLGRAIALALARHGCFLTLTGRNQQRLSETKQKCIEMGLNDNDILLVPADMQYETEIKTIVDNTAEKFDKLDFIVNNAGIVRLDALDDSMEKYHEVMQIDVHSIVYLNKLAFPLLEKTKGAIVNVSSIGGIRPLLGTLAYGMAKAALDHYTRIKSMEIAHTGVRINNINPGIIGTAIFANAGVPAPLIDAIIEKARTWNEMGRDCLPEDVTGAVCFLLSSKSQNTTGAHVAIDGGFVSMCYNSSETVDVIEALKNIQK